jgi:hypothetical protein
VTADVVHSDVIEQCNHQEQPGSRDAVVLPSRNTNACSVCAASLMLDGKTRIAGPSAEMRLAFLKKPLDVKVIQEATAQWRALGELLQGRL